MFLLRCTSRSSGSTSRSCTTGKPFQKKQDFVVRSINNHS
uniref:Uncharacterized protein n=1 Tax=Anguilla anguilla TaxID=7936 RepID=A0A0E9SRD0_ANGAN